MSDSVTRLIRPIDDLFRPNATGLWATTYNLDLSLFNEFLLPRLGEPPLNVVVLADASRLAKSLARVPLEQVDSLASVNRRWLLRGVRIGTALFRPKTYLTVTARTATLLVGSGNLSENGINGGREASPRSNQIQRWARRQSNPGLTGCGVWLR